MSKTRNSVGINKSDSRFSRTVHSEIEKSTFNRNQIHKTAFDAGELVPIYIDEVLPGDEHEIDLAYVTRMATPIFPVMDDLELDFYFFFVPNRLTWENWQALHGENNTDVSWVPEKPPATVPQVRPLDTAPVTDQLYGRIGDYYGIPPDTDYSNPQLDISVLPFRGYALIWNRWFRDQNLQPPIPVDLSDNNLTDVDGNSSNFLYNPNKPLLEVCKKHDYFTSCLPYSYKPMSQTGGGLDPFPLDRVPFFMNNQTGVPQTFPTNSAELAQSIMTNAVSPNFGDTPGGSNPQGNSSANNMIQALRSGFQLMKFLERDARAGTRYVELIKAHFNVESEDYRLQYPEFLGSHHTVVGMSQVPQTSSTDATSPQGNLAAYSLTTGKSVVFKKSFVEHGFIHGFAVARQRKTYQDGIERFWSRRDKFDYFYPEFAHIAEQPVLIREIYSKGLVPVMPSPQFNSVFGYQEAWADYRYKPNRVSSNFRSSHPFSLQAWHYADEYHNLPFLGPDFITDNSRENVQRTLAVNDPGFPQIFADLKIINKTTRPIPLFSIGGFADHF